MNQVGQAVDCIVASYERISALVAALSHEYARVTGTHPTITTTMVPEIRHIPVPTPIVYPRGVEPWDKVQAEQST